MKFASTMQIVVLSIVACAGLFALDYIKNPQLWHHTAETQSAAEPHGARIRLWINHLCCTECLQDVRQALTNLPGVGLPPQPASQHLLTQAEANQQTASLSEYGNAIDLNVTDLDTLDLIAVDNALRQKGLVAGHIELGGIEHFSLAAQVEHLCCGLCQRSIHDRMAFIKARALGGQFKWLDSVDLNPEQKTIIAYARFLETGKTVDVTEFISALNEVGFAPSSLHLRHGEHQLMQSMNH